MFLEILENWINIVKSFIDLLSDFGASENNLSTDKDEEDDPGLDHPAGKY